MRSRTKIISNPTRSAYLSFVSALILLVFSSHNVSGANPADPALITYGSAALPIEGDDDYTMVVYFKVPKSEKRRLYLRIFDADAGGEFDLGYGPFDTKTRFMLYGGEKAFSAETARTKLPKQADLKAGVLIKTKTFGESSLHDANWRTFAAFEPAEGEPLGAWRVFKLVIQGLEGNDGNIFDIAVSVQEDENDRPENLDVFTYSPTFRVAGRGLARELEFPIPAGTDQIIIHDFDAAGAKSRLETRFDSVPLTSSGQGVENKSIVNVDKGDEAREAAMLISGGRENPNDLTIYLTDGRGTSLPIALPLRSRRPNQRPNPRADIDVLDDCLSVSFDGSRSSDNDGDILKFEWDFDDGSQGSGQSVVHRYQSSGAYQPMLYLTDQSTGIDQGSTKRFYINLNQPPIAKVEVSKLVAAPNKLVTFNASGSQDPDGKLKSFRWDFNDGSTGRGSKVSHAFRNPGSYRVRLSVEDNSGLPCSVRSEVVDVKINWPPIAEIGPGRIASVGENVLFDGSRSYDVDGDIKVLSWDLGDGTQIQGPTVEHAYKAPGTYRVTLTVEDNAGVENSTDTSQRIIIVNARPVAAAGEDRSSAVGQVIDFNGANSFDRDGKIVEYAWDFGNGSVASGPRVSYAFRRPGEYQVKLSVRDDSASSSATAEDKVLVRVNSPPTANAGPDQLVTSSEVRFDGSASTDSDGKVAQYFWEFGDGATSAKAAPVHVYRKTGNYKVRLTVMDDSGMPRNSSVDELNVVVNAAPIADAGAYQVVAPDQPVTFSAFESFDPDGKISKSLWDFGDGQSAEGETVEHNFSRPGKYTVLLAVQDETGDPEARDFDHTEIWVNAPPIANAGADRLAAPGDTIIFDGSGSTDPDGNLLAFNWEFSNEKESFQGKRISRKFLKPGNYAARLSVTDDAGTTNSTSQDKLTIKINHSPKAVLGDDIFTDHVTVDFDGSASVDPDGDPLNYTWYFGDGTPPGEGVRTTHLYKKGGVYPVVLKVDDGTRLPNSTDAAALTLTINRPPIADAGSSRSVCAGDIVAFDGGKSFDPDGDLLKYRWKFGDGSDAPGVNPTKIYKNPGSYPITLTIKDDSGIEDNKDSAQVFVNVDEAPIADAGPDQQVCTNRDVEFDGSKSTDLDGVVNRFSWNFGDGRTGAGVRPVHAYLKPGIYRTRLTIEGDTSGSCDNLSSDEMTVTVLEAPVAKFIGPESAPLTTPITFDASVSTTPKGTIKAWLWDFGDGSKGEGEKIVHQYNQPGKYIVTLTIRVDDKGGACSTNFSKSAIFVNAPPVAVAGEDRVVGIGENVVFDASGSNDENGAISKYRWDFGDGKFAYGVEVRHRYLKSGTYDAKLTVTDTSQLANNSASDSLAVRVNATPVPAIAGPIKTCVGQRTKFGATGSEDQDGDKLKYSWNFGDGQVGQGSGVAHVYSKPGNYTVTLTADDGRSLRNSRAYKSTGVLVNQAPLPVANFRQVAVPGTDVEFDGSGSVDRDGSIVDYQWDFGQGLKMNGKRVIRKFEKSGRYKVRFRVTDDSGTSCGIAEQLHEITINSRPNAVAGADRQAYSGGVHDTVTFDATKSSDPDGDPLTYLWNFGDGNTDAGPIVKHRYSRSGTYKVKLRVDDGQGHIGGGAPDELIVKVRERP